jgi:hypothetical protein
VIELNEKMLILKRFVTKNDFFSCRDKENWTVRPLPPIEPLSPLSVPSLLPSVEVSGPKTINIKQYLNTNNFSSNLHKQHNFILKKYCVGSRFNRVIELNEKMLILNRFVTKNDFFSCWDKEN